MSRISDPEFPLHFRLPKEKLDELRTAAKKEDRSVCYLTRRIVIEWLERRKGK
jgi:hypothetical protein